MPQKVVAHFLDHRIVKGTTVAIDPTKPVCHIHTPADGMQEVELVKLKALFIVKDLAGRPQYREASEPNPTDLRLCGSREVYILFRDGEHLSGLVNGQRSARQFFWVLPIDPESNNIRILVNRSAVLGISSADGSLMSA